MKFLTIAAFAALICPIWAEAPAVSSDKLTPEQTQAWAAIQNKIKASNAELEKRNVDVSAKKLAWYEAKEAVERFFTEEQAKINAEIAKFQADAKREGQMPDANDKWVKAK